MEAIWDWLFKRNSISRSVTALLHACGNNYLQNKVCVDCVLPNDLDTCDGFPPVQVLIASSLYAEKKKIEERINIV